MCLNFYFHAALHSWFVLRVSWGPLFYFFSGLNLIFVSVKEFVIAIIICEMKNRDGFFYQTECYVIILYTCVCIIDLNVDILWDGCIFKIC